ncbi:ABC transporter transmembrane domain-containing protein [Nakamurella flava]|uniref:ABC transporter transmembrane domain-containing protein n=1 Tax=Nakamurella flava TaxID=2576308 RepID=UPI003B845566
MRRIWSYCWRHRTITLLAALSAVVGVGLGALVPLLTQVAIDDATAGSTAGLGWVVAGLVGLAVVQFGSSFLRRWAGGRLSLDVQHDMRQDVFSALQRLDGAGQDRLQTGQVVSRASSDLQMVQSLLAMVPLSAGQVVLFVASLAIMLTLSPLLTLTALIVVPAVVVVSRATRTVLFPATWSAQQSAAEVAGIVEENVTGVRVVKGFGQEEREVGRLDAGARRLFADRMRAVRLTGSITPALQGLTALGQVAVLGIGGYLALNGTITLGTFLAFTLYLAQLVAPTRMLTLLLVTAQQARASVERVLEIIDTLPVITDPEDPQPLPDGPLDVAFTGVRFGYAPDQPVLDSFELHVPAGRTVAVVGSSGSGKSTLSLLLPRFYDPQRGTVAVGGRDVRAVGLQELRGNVGVVFEEAFLFSDTIAANIAYGRPDADREQVRAAARAAEAADFIEALPQGYDTVIGERGLTLSGGQRQRLALARAMITDPRVLVLDDATSAVDPVTEAAILATLGRLTADRTTLLIAHRRSTLLLADVVAVMDRGRVVDMGPHDELLTRCQAYRDLLGGALAPAEPSGPAPAPTTAPDPVPAEPADAGSDPTGLTPELWPDPTDAPAPGRAVRAAAERIGPRGGGGMGGFLGSGPATPELLARVDALPAARDEPLALSGPTDDPGDESAPVEPGTPTPPFSLWRTLRPVRWLLALALLLVALDALAGLALPALVRYGVDHGVSAGSLGVILGATGVSLVVVGATYLIQRWQYIAAGRAGENVLYRLRRREFVHLQRLGLDYYEREMGGRILTRMTTDVDALSTFLQTGLVTAVVSLATFVGIAVVLLVMNAGLALIAFSVLPVVLVSTIVFRRYSARAYNDARDKVSVVNADLQENVAGLRVAQAMGRERTNADTFAARSEAYRRSRMRAQTAISLYFPLVALLSQLSAAAVLGMGTVWVVAGTLSVGTLIAFVLYLDSFFTPIQQLSQIFDSYQQAQVGLRRIGELLDTPTTTPPHPNPIAVTRADGDVRAQDVTFHYGAGPVGTAASGRPVDGGQRSAAALDGVTLDLRSGSTVAVVGSTGAGKSTLVKLIARYYDVTGGAIQVDGRDIRTFDLPSYRRRLGVVPQEPHLFSGTVRDNIAYGRPDATDAQVEAAARAVGAIGAIGRLPGGFRHPVDERGRNLSAGQRQLLSLARAELVDPDILLLDEATAALDPAAEAAVLTATERLARGRTTVVVAHRLTTAARADQIVVMEHGRVAEVGRHDELLGTGGAYHRLYAELTAASGGPSPTDGTNSVGPVTNRSAGEASITSIGSAP